jgi:uncharacterized cupredoxin-like copper-binding protein
MLRILFAFIIINYTALGFSQEAVFFVKKGLHKFHKSNEGDTLEHTFIIENHGDNDLIIYNYEVECSCTNVIIPEQTIAPGKTSTLTFTFNTDGRPFLQDRKIRLVTNTKNKEEYLRFKVFVKPKKLKG